MIYKNSLILYNIDLFLFFFFYKKIKEKKKKNLIKLVLN
jgi:hypothetical protein